jgi:Mrp family chromosome partitioning ATPase
MVIFDTPPCLMLSDPILLGEKVDGILYLVGLGLVSRELAPQAVQRIRSTGVDVLGMICNQVTYPTRLNDYGYEYGYHYHYAYAGGYRYTYAKQRQSKAEEAKSAEQPSVDAETRRLVGNYANSADVQTRLGQDDTLAEDSSPIIAKAARPSIKRFLPRWGRGDR